MVFELEVTVTGDPKITVTVLETVTADAVTVMLAAVALVRVTVAVPVPPLVDAVGAESVPPPAAVKETTVPSTTAVLSAFFTMAVMVTDSPTTGEAGDDVSVIDAGASGLTAGNQSTPQPAISIVHTAKIQTTLCMTPP